MNPEKKPVTRKKKKQEPADLLPADSLPKSEAKNGADGTNALVNGDTESGNNQPEQLQLYRDGKQKKNSVFRTKEIIKKVSYYQYC